jgi:CDP-glucose 4,6-dehydratase
VDFRGKNVLITGAGGFVGQNAVLSLAARGAHPIGLMRTVGMRTDMRTVETLRKSGILLCGDIADTHLLSDVMARYEVEYVLHLAAISIVGQCSSNPEVAYKVNVNGVVSLMEAVRRLHHPPKKVICMSTDKSYSASSPPGGYTEDTPFGIGDAYCASKACGDIIARSYAKTYGIPVCVVRAGNLYGPMDMNVSRLIPKSIIKLLNGERPVLYSNAAEFVREFIYVQDIIDAYDVLFEKGEPGEAYNVGGTPPQRILDVLSKISEKVTGNSRGFDVQEVPFEEIPQQHLDATRLMDLGWKAATSLSNGLDKTIAWYRENAGHIYV